MSDKYEISTMSAGYHDKDAVDRVEAYVNGLYAKSYQEIEQSLPPMRSEVEASFKNGHRLIDNTHHGMNTLLGAYGGLGGGAVVGIAGATIFSAMPAVVLVGGVAATAAAGMGIGAAVPSIIGGIKEWRARRAYLGNPKKVLDPVRRSR